MKRTFLSSLTLTLLAGFISLSSFAQTSPPLTSQEKSEIYNIVAAMQETDNTIIPRACIPVPEVNDTCQTCPFSSGNSLALYICDKVGGSQAPSGNACLIGCKRR